MEYYFAVYKLVVFVILAVASVIDIKKRIIPDKLIIAGAIIGVVMNVAAVIMFDVSSIFEACLYMITGMLAGGLPLLAAEIINHWLAKRQGVGGGDIKLYAMCGIFMGFHLTLSSYIILSIISLVAIVLMLMFKKIKRGEYIPFGPFISAAVFITIFLGMDKSFLLT